MSMTIDQIMQAANQYGFDFEITHLAIDYYHAEALDGAAEYWDNQGPLALLRAVQVQQLDSEIRVQNIVDTKARAGKHAYLSLHSSGGCILWPSERHAEEDDGKRAIDRWQLTATEATALRGTGVVDN